MFKKQESPQWWEQGAVRARSSRLGRGRHSPGTVLPGSRDHVSYMEHQVACMFSNLQNCCPVTERTAKEKEEHRE